MGELDDFIAFEKRAKLCAISMSIHALANGFELAEIGAAAALMEQAAYEIAEGKAIEAALEKISASVIKEAEEVLKNVD